MFRITTSLSQLPLTTTNKTTLKAPFSVNCFLQLWKSTISGARAVIQKQVFVYTVYVLSKQTWLQHPGKLLCISLCVLFIKEEPNLLKNVHGCVQHFLHVYISLLGSQRLPRLLICSIRNSSDNFVHLGWNFPSMLFRNRIVAWKMKLKSSDSTI